MIEYQTWSVYPAEIEFELLTHPDIAQVAVVGAYDPEDVKDEKMTWDFNEQAPFSSF